MKYLILLHADVNRKSRKGYVPLVYAAQTGSLEGVKMLMDAGAKLDLAGDADTTPLCEAADWNYADVVSLLVRKGAALNAIGAHSRDGQTPLLRASVRGNAEVVEELLRLGADRHVRDAAGRSILDLAPRYFRDQLGHLLRLVPDNARKPLAQH